MSVDPRKLKGAAALMEIVERLKTFGAEAEKALGGEGLKHQSFDVETPFGKMSGRLGMRMGPAMRRPPGAAPRRPAPRAADLLVDVHFDGAKLIVTTETDDPAAQVGVEGDRMTIRSARAPERQIALPCRVDPASLAVRVVNGILEASMSPESLA